MNYITDDRHKSSKPLIKNLPAILVGLVLILGGATVYRLVATDDTPTEVATPVMPEIKTVTALGRIEPEGEIVEVSVSSAADGNRIEELLVRQGDIIERGDVIAILDRDRLEAALNQAREQVRVAEANLAKVKAGAKTGEIRASRSCDRSYPDRNSQQYHRSTGNRIADRSRIK